MGRTMIILSSSKLYQERVGAEERGGKQAHAGTRVSSSSSQGLVETALRAWKSLHLRLKYLGRWVPRIVVPKDEGRNARGMSFLSQSKVCAAVVLSERRTRVGRKIGPEVDIADVQSIEHPGANLSI